MKSLKTIFFLVVIILFSSCEEHEVKEQKQELKIKSIKAIKPKLTNAKIPPDNNGDKYYFIQIEFEPMPEYPDEGYWNQNQEYLGFKDNGLIYDQTANDGIFTSLELVQVFDEYNNLIEEPDKIEIEIKCSFTIINPGTTCQGTICPNRSILGGRTWFCICTGLCTFNYKVVL